MKQALDSRWYAIFDLAAASTAAILTMCLPILGGWPLILGLLPWIFRALAGKAPLRRTSYDLVLLVFLITAGVGVWAAYQPGPAWSKFWMLACSILLFYSLANQPKTNWITVSTLFGLIGFCAAALFLLTNDWIASPAKVGALNRVLIAWMHARPELHLPTIPPNTAAGVSALTGGFLIVVCNRAWQERKWLFALLYSIPILIVLVTLVVAGSRGVWMALAVILGGWVLGKLGQRFSQRAHVSLKTVWTSEALLGAGLVIGLVIWQPALIIRLAGTLPGPAQAGNRLELDRSDLELIADYPFTGGGLGEFAGQYSQYIMYTPVYLLGYGHNIILDAALEQGILGGLSLCVLLIGSLWRLVTLEVHGFDALFRLAIASGLVVLVVHGLVDDVIYNSQFLPLLLVLPGLACALAARLPAGSPAIKPSPIAWGVGCVVVIALGIIFSREILSLWYSNLGAVQMAKVELADYPSGRWHMGEHLSELLPAESLFEKALTLDQDNPTASYRLGMILFQRQDFSTAADYFRSARVREPGHRGIQKVLGLSLVWQGQIDEAKALLLGLPEIRDELSAYPNYWQILGRNDLAENATNLLEQLTGAGAL